MASASGENQGDVPAPEAGEGAGGTLSLPPSGPAGISSAAGWTSGPGSGEAVPGRVGPYRVLQVLGEGGMGVVYLAEQREPVRRPCRFPVR